MFTGGKYLMRFLLFQALVVGALCCSCTYEHPQQHFCDHEFVMKVLIKESLDVEIGSGFSMEITRIFKGNISELNVTDGRFADLVMPPACHIDYMKTGDKYVIYGDNQDGQVYTELCSGSQPWPIPSKFFRRGLAKFYKSGCDCSNEIGPYSSAKRCYWKYSFLKKSGDQCAWINTKYLRSCLTGTPSSSFYK